MKFLHRRSTKGVAAVATVFTTAAFLVQLAMPSALAVSAPTKVASFFPALGGPYFNDVTDSTEMAVLSNKPNGVNTGAQLTAVTEAADTTITAATQVSWYYCDTGTFPPNAAHCTLIGTDTTPTDAFATAAYTAAGGKIDDAWSTIWNIPIGLTGDTKDIVVEGCNGAPATDFANCTKYVVPALLDGGGGPLPQTSSGVITSPTNGSAVSDQVDLTMKASTSPELTAVGFGFNGADSVSPEGDGDVDTTGGSDDSGAYNDLAPDTTTATAKTWSVTVPAAGDLGTEIKNSETALTLWSTNGDMNFTGSGAAAPGGVVSAVCSTACTSATAGGLAFDRIYVVAEDGKPGVADHVSLKRTPDVTSDPTCATGPSSIFTGAGTMVNLTGCVFDAFGTAVGSEGVFWSLTNTSPATGSFVGTPLLVSDTSGHATATVSSTAAAAGGSTVVTFCLDHNKDAVCDGAAPKSATFTITWSTAVPPTHHARSISLRLRDALTARGRVTAGGFAACVSNVPVKIQRKVSGVWRTIRRVSTGAGGFYRAHVADRAGRYRAVAPRVTKTGGMDICNRAVSPVRMHA